MSRLLHYFDTHFSKLQSDCLSLVLLLVMIIGFGMVGFASGRVYWERRANQWHQVAVEVVTVNPVPIDGDQTQHRSVVRYQDKPGTLPKYRQVTISAGHAPGASLILWVRGTDTRRTDPHDAELPVMCGGGVVGIVIGIAWMTLASQRCSNREAAENHERIEAARRSAQVSQVSIVREAG